MVNGGKARPRDIREQYESELREIKEALGEAHLQIYALKKFKPQLDEDEKSWQAQLSEEGHVVTLVKICRRQGLPRRSLCYRPQSRKRVINGDLVARVKLALERFPSYGHRRLAYVLGENLKLIQRILQFKGWQVRIWPQGFSPRAWCLPSVASGSDERWATDLTHVWCGKDRRTSLAVIIDSCTREILSWRLSDNGSSRTADAALEEALVYRLGALGRVQQPLALRSDNGLDSSSRHYTSTVKAYDLIQEFTTQYTPEQNGLVKRFLRSLKEECFWLYRFESLGQARVVIRRWIQHYNEERPHQSLDYVAPRAHPALIA